MKEWITDQQTFDDFLRVFSSNEKFAKTLAYYNLLMNSDLAGTRMFAFWEFNDYIFENGFWHLKDAIFDYIEGRR